MSKPMSYDDKLRGDFRRYLLKVVCNKADATLTEAEILRAFDLAVQKQKLTTLEAELLVTKHQVKKSKIDISGPSYEELYETGFILQTAMYRLADVAIGVELGEWLLDALRIDGYDEPRSALLARKALYECYKAVLYEYHKH